MAFFGWLFAKVRRASGGLRVVRAVKRTLRLNIELIFPTVIKKLSDCLMAIKYFPCRKFSKQIAARAAYTRSKPYATARTWSIRHSRSTHHTHAPKRVSNRCLLRTKIMNFMREILHQILWCHEIQLIFGRAKNNSIIIIMCLAAPFYCAQQVNRIESLEMQFQGSNTDTNNTHDNQMNNTCNFYNANTWTFTRNVTYVCTILPCWFIPFRERTNPWN